MSNTRKWSGLLSMAIMTILAAPSADAYVFWNTEDAQYYGIPQPLEYTEAMDCLYLARGPQVVTVGMPATYEIWVHPGTLDGYTDYPLAGAVPGAVFIWNNNTQRLIGFPLLEGEDRGETIHFTYISQEAGSQMIWMSGNDWLTGARDESYDMYSADVDPSPIVTLDYMFGERWCEGGQLITSVNPSTDPSSTPGKVTGGGWIADRKSNFGFTAQYDAVEGLKGHLTYIDKDYGKFESTALDYLTINGTHATLIGVGAFDGVPVSFTAEVDDVGEPGAGSDRFNISWTGGYTRGGVLNGGNIQIHR